MPNLRWQELLIIVALVVLLFGAKRLPDAARGLGRSLRIFKAETKGMHDDDATSESGEGKPSSPEALESGKNSTDTTAQASETSPERNDS
jgi:sec-independent protein translocase protein TatA